MSNTNAILDDGLTLDKYLIQDLRELKYTLMASKEYLSSHKANVWYVLPLSTTLCYSK